MYRWDALRHNTPNIASSQEEMDFYLAYMGGPL